MRALLTLNNQADRDKATKWIGQAPAGTRVEFRKPRRTLPQNDRLWAMLTEIAEKVDHCGRKYDPDTWKCIFMSALGREMRFVPSLDQQGLIPLGHRSSNLSKEEMSELQDFIEAWCAENGIEIRQ